MRGHRDRSGADRIGKTHALARDFVDVRCVRKRETVAAEMIGAQRVDGDDENVGFRRAAACAEHDRENEKEEASGSGNAIRDQHR